MKDKIEPPVDLCGGPEGGNASESGATKKLKLGLFNGLMEPVSDEEWEQMDEEIRVKFVEDDLF